MKGSKAEMALLGLEHSAREGAWRQGLESRQSPDHGGSSKLCKEYSRVMEVTGASLFQNIGFIII